MSLLSFLKSKLSVEPTGFLYFVTLIFSGSLGTNLLLYKACDPTGGIVHRIGAKCDIETEAQHIVAPINGWKGIIQQVIPMVVTMFAGAWSDRHGQRRQPLILGPVIGLIISDILSAFCTIQWSISPWITAVLQSLPLAISGGSPLMFIGIFSHVADTTTIEIRTIKYGLVTCTIFLGGIFGMLIYGNIVLMLGFFYTYTVSIAMGIVNICLVLIFVKDATASYTKKPLVKDIIDTVNPMNIFRSWYGVISKTRSRHVSLVLWLVVLLCSPLVNVPLEGENAVTYLYLRKRFNWNEVDFSIFNAYQMSILLIGSLISLGLLSHIFKWDDALIGLLTSFFDLLAAIAFFFASEPWQVYCVPLLELFRGAGLAITGSIASKCVQSDELGSMNSIKLLVECCMQGIFLPVYNNVYNATLETMPNAFFLLSTLLTTPLLFLFCVIYFLTRKTAKSTSKDESTHNQNETNNVEMNN
ncbi:hippocampus abundant transcript-like protein 1 [Daktulosphaira vitifoliae]|uniref:hippocampus abundant transcript-like protein 1 n=1 Tax=Daktulosphaira vitifoliae TaxID=58002 RepID=UPI0021AA0A85|nr:hippocampus abundant transcript-like protein 1 [Daktulosphaira vitifoliae]